MSKVVQAIVGVVETVVGVFTGNPALIVSGIATTASALLSPRAKQQVRQAQATTLQIGETARQAIFGEVMVGGSLMDAFNFGGKYGTDWEVRIIGLADHRCAALSGLYVTDTYVPFTGDGAVAGYNGQLEVYWLPGTEMQTMPSIVTAHGPGWTPSDNAAGVSVAVVAYKCDAADAKHPVWTAGRPTFAFVVKGKLCYIGRNDSTVGGSGSHRWDDPSTWQWTDNPIDCRYNWARGVFACDRVDQPDMLLVGRGLSAIEAPPENTFWRANLCDELVPLAARGSERRYRVAALINADDQFLDTEEMFAATCGGVITQPEGSVEIEPGHAKAPVAYISDDDIVAGSKVTFDRFRSEADDQWINTVIPRYIEPAQKWVDHAAAIRRAYADVLADGRPREATLSLATISNTQAQRCGEIMRRMGRLTVTATKTLGPRFAGVEEGDWMVWTSARRTAGVATTFRVESFSLDEKWQNGFSERQIADNVYAWSTADEVAPGAVANQQDPPPGIGTPDAGDWAVVGGSVIGTDGSTQPALLVSGAADDRYTDAILIEHRVDDGTDPAAAADWISDGSIAGTTEPVRRAIAPVEPDKPHYVAIRYRVGGVIGERLILGPVTTGAVAGAGAGAVAIRSAYYTASGAVLTASAVGGDGHIAIAAQTWDYPTLHTEVVRGGAALTGLDVGTSYWVYFDDATLVDTAPAYQATMVPGDALNGGANPARHYLGGVAIPAAGAPPASGGGGGGGYGCPDPATPILMANAAHDGPGRHEAAGGIVAFADWVWTRPELADGTLGTWGAYQVIHAATIWCDDLREGAPDGRHLRASATHLLRRGDRWQPYEELAPPAGSGWVVRMTVAIAHTYVANGLMSHNKLAHPTDD